MAVYRRKGSPYYHTEFRVAGQRFRQSTGCTTEREARAEERRLKKEAREQARQARSQAPGLNLDQAFERYWEEHGQHLSWASEVDRYSVALLSHLDPELPVADLTDAEVNDFVQAWTGGTYALNRALAVLRGVHNRARKRWKQPTHVIDWGDFMNAEEKRVRWITLEEAMRLVANLPPHIALAVEWSLYTGCREAETFNLMWADVHMDRGYAVVRAKGGKMHTVWLSEQALDVLVRAKTTCTQWVNEVFDTRNKRRAFQKGLDAAGIADFCWHDLRHTFATWMRQAGAPLEVVQRACGHAQLSTTERYAHVADPEVRDAVRRLPSIVPTARVVVAISEGRAKA